MNSLNNTFDFEFSLETEILDHEVQGMADPPRLTAITSVELPHPFEPTRYGTSEQFGTQYSTQFPPSSVHIRQALESDYTIVDKMPSIQTVAEYPTFLEAPNKEQDFVSSFDHSCSATISADAGSSRGYSTSDEHGFVKINEVQYLCIPDKSVKNAETIELRKNRARSRNRENAYEVDSHFRSYDI